MIRVELGLLLRRPRTWVSLLLLIGLPVLIAVFVATTKIAPRPGTGPPFLSQVLSNGTLFAAGALALVVPLFLPLAVLIVAGDSVAGDAASGMLRYLLVRPVGRTRLLVAKLLSIITYVLLAVVLVAAGGLVSGRLLFGSTTGGGVPSLSGGPPLTGSQAALRIGLTIGYVAVSMLGVAAFGLFLSTATSAPLGATLGGFALLVASGVLDTLDAAGVVKPYLPTHYWPAFVDLFRNPILWRNVERGLLLQVVYVLVLLGASWALFTTRDIRT